MVNFHKVKDLAKENGVSASFLCSKVGKGVTYIADVQRKGFAVPRSTVEVWADILGTTAEYLTDETDDPNPPAVPEDEIKFALFGGEKCTEDEWQEVLRYVEFVKSKRNG